ncbi:MAG: class I SAM-dependent methyltransferase [Desulfotalea sp.]
MYKEISKCRISGSKELVNILSLGHQSLTGVFPKNKDDLVAEGPMDLLWCPKSGLVQLKQTYNAEDMYGDNYGYRSGLNNSMVAHLTDKFRYLEKMVELKSNDLVIDIGSNDSTGLNCYLSKDIMKVGVDPTGKKFQKYYEPNTILLDDFFSAALVKKNLGGKKARIVTSIAMFYDLEDPKQFVEDISSILADDGVWHFEQSYMPSMLRANAYDTICHEHVEFYSFKVVNQLLNDCGMRVVDVQMNSVNGGSFAVTACLHDSKRLSNMPIINWMLTQEQDMQLDTPRPYRDFEEKVYLHRKNLVNLIDSLVEDGKKIFGYGASTKGNVLLQFCGIDSSKIPFIAEVNEDKFGSFTPGTNIPIIPEAEARAMKPDYFLVLPWHFKHSILEREKDFRLAGGKFLFPLPQIEIV